MFPMMQMNPFAAMGNAGFNTYNPMPMMNTLAMNAMPMGGGFADQVAFSPQAMAYMNGGFAGMQQSQMMMALGMMMMMMLSSMGNQGMMNQLGQQAAGVPNGLNNQAANAAAANNYADNTANAAAAGNTAANNAAATNYNGQIQPFNGQTAKPTENYRVSSEFGPRNGSMHGGIDLAAPTGTPIRAFADGVVTQAGNDPGGYGNWVEIKHADGKVTRYGHMSAIGVQKGQKVGAGSEIGKVGSTGNSTGPHLHFEIRENGTAVNPRKYMNF